MAASSKYGFHYRRHLIPNCESPAMLEVIISDSAGNLTIGDKVQWTGGYLMGSAPDAAFLGFLAGFVTSKGENIFKTKDSITGTKTGDDTYNASATNTTVDQVKGVVIVDPQALFFGYCDDTLTQAMVGNYFYTVATDGTYADSADLTGQGAYVAGTQDVQLVELVTTLDDGSTSTKAGLWRIARSQIAINDPTA